MFCYCGRRKSERPHTHIHKPKRTHSHRFSRSALGKKKTQKLLAAYHFFLCTFFSSVGVPRDRGRGQKGREGDRGWGNICDWEKASPVTRNGPSSFHFQLEHAHIRGEEVDRGVMLWSALGTCRSTGFTLPCWQHKEWLRGRLHEHTQAGDNMYVLLICEKKKHYIWISN